MAGDLAKAVTDLVQAVRQGRGALLMGADGVPIVQAAPGTLPWALGFAMGALVQLVMSELLPESYRQAGPRSIALVTVVAMGIVVLLQSVAA